MRRWWWWMLLVGAVVVLSGCGGGDGVVTGIDGVPRISPLQARGLLEEGDAVLYDTRSADAYRSQHAAGAVSLPEEEVMVRIDELLGDDRALIFY